MKDGDVAARSLRVGKRPDVGPQVVVDSQRVDVGLVALAAEHLTHPARAVSDGVAAMGGGHPLVDDHSLGARRSALGVRAGQGQLRPEDPVAPAPELRLFASAERRERPSPGR